MRRGWDIFLIFSFLLLVSGGCYLTFSRQSESYSQEEKRKLAECPRLTKDTLSRFPQRFEAYASDNMAFRKELIRTRNSFKYELWKVSGSPSVLVGHNDWLYFLGDGSTPVFRHEQPYSQKDLQHWHAVLKQRSNWCRERGIEYVFVAAPDKPTIYPEFLPNGFKPVRDESRLDQLTKYLGQDPEIKFVNLASGLKQNKDKAPLYLKTDTHWNHLGAYIGYCQLMQVLNASFPMLSPIAASQLKFTNAPYTTGDCLGLLGLFGVKQESAPTLIQCGKLTFAPGEAYCLEGRDPSTLVTSDTTAGGKSLKLLVLHDSFGESLKPFLSQHFSKVRWVKQDDLTCDSDVILADKPDILIQEVVERRLVQFTPYFMEDWRKWVLERMHARGAKDVYLSLLPNTPEIAAARLARLKETGAANIKPISCREWSESGDKVTFDEKTALYPDWYLLKSGDQGFKFIDEESKKAYGKLQKFITESGSYEKDGELKLADGSIMQLYRRR